ncbi:hypothetical protein [Nocardioides jiangxiensis]|uniref:BIG2 domain-containing protein n=1 Tax=Nocardioides jiangxiensis TaxID=3064524 RepID=A0ABT9B1G4_9ACTN|nr:hypothetical protein [Nocardioides sp. WY-20]MDO7868523.1 hypothetical protein [Nocardioides sp. WY-20]
MTVIESGHSRGGRAVRVYIHGDKPVEMVDVEETVFVSTLVPDGATVWAEDAEAPLDAAATVAEVTNSGRAAVHVGRGQVTVSVAYNGATKSAAFGPGVRIQKVLDWATGPDGFAVNPVDAASLVLRLSGSAADLDSDEHVGSLAADGVLALDLVAGVRFAG